jgi:hypothetical protein
VGAESLMRAPKQSTRGTRMHRVPVSYRFAVESSPTQARRLCSIAQLENNSADFHVLWTERQKTMSAHPSRRAQEHRLPACVWDERRLRNSASSCPQFFALLCKSSVISTLESVLDRSDFSYYSEQPCFVSITPVSTNAFRESKGVHLCSQWPDCARCGWGMVRSGSG